jgi:hypothetical protein
MGVQMNICDHPKAREESEYIQTRSYYIAEGKKSRMFGMKG